MEFLHFLEKIRIPVLDEFMLLITRLGEEEAFLIAALVVFWCISKNLGYYILSVGFIGTIANQFMKLWFRIPRPWDLDPNFTILEQGRKAATGYSFPSGHTQCAVGTFGAFAITTRKRWVRISAITVAILVPFSRMYIGVHAPKDICVAALIAVLLLVILKPLSKPGNDRFFGMILPVMILLSICYLLFVNLYSFPVDIDKDNLTSGIESAYTLLGAIIGFVFVLIADRKWIQFSTEAVWWVQILKVALGLGLVLMTRSLTKTPLNFLFGAYAGRSIRYFSVVIMAGCIWPMTFKWFQKIGKINNTTEED